MRFEEMRFEKESRIIRKPQKLADCRATDNVLLKFKPPENAVNIFFDMDGCLTVFRDVRQPYTKRDGTTDYFHMEDLYDRFYYRDLPENKNMVKAARLLTRKSFVNMVLEDFREQHGVSGIPDKVNVYTFSCFLSDSEFAFDEKHGWIGEHLPEVDKDHRILLPCGLIKGEHLVTEGNRTVLIDDYTKNLIEFTLCGGVGIKCLNDINHTHKTWSGKTIHIKDSPEKIARTILEHALELEIKVPEGGLQL